MRVIICEDEQYWSEAIKASISKWSIERKINCEFNCIKSPQKLLNHLKIQTDTDVLFLDILLGEKVVDGMNLAKCLRKMGNKIPIIFITADTLQAVDGYLVEAIGYLSKPIDEDRLSLFLDRIIKLKRSQRIIKIMTDNRVTNVYQKDIVYAEINDHTVIFHTIQGSLRYRGTLGEIVELLDKDFFVKIHRSYVIAIGKIDSIKITYPYEVYLLKDDTLVNIPVSRKYINKLLEMYSDDVLEKMK